MGDCGPVVDIRQEGVILGVPNGGPDVAELVHGLWVVESHASGVQELHHLPGERKGGVTTANRS